MGFKHLRRTILLLGLPLLLLVNPGSASLPGPSAGSEAGTTISVGHESRQDDMPSIAAAPDGSLWVVWLSFDGQRDDVAIRHFRDGIWQNLHWVPGTSGDSWLPQIGVDSANRVWVVWSQQLDSNWDVLARRFDPSESTWGPLVRLSSDPLPDVNPRMSPDGRGGLAVAWQGFRRKPEAHPTAKSHIFSRQLDGDRWTETIQVTDGAQNDWAPSPAIDSQGVVWISYDTYRNGSFDVCLAQIVGRKVVKSRIPVAATPAFEARATTSVDSEDRVWVAWEFGPRQWGKDNGRALGNRGTGAPLGGFREPRIACLAQGRWLEPVSPLEAVFRPYNTYQPHVFSDGSGSIRVVAMERRTGGPTKESVLFRKRSYPEYWRGRQDGYWSYWVTHLQGEQWTAPRLLPNSKGRSSTRMGAALSKGKDLWMIWPTDNRRESYYHRPLRQQVYVGVAPSTAGTPPVLRERRIEATEPDLRQEAELGHLERIAGYRTRIDGKDHRLLRGDLHRHTELSWDEGGANDGSLDDYYRYMLDAASLDFGANTEHQGGAWPYWWWYSQKMSDMYHLPGAYVSLFAHERSASYPYGHRNVFYSDRAKAKVIPFFLKDGVSLYAFPLTPEGDEPADEAGFLVANDTELLFEEVRARGGITIAHTSGSGMGTDWHHRPEPDVEPVVEIFQGARRSFEQVGAPYSSTQAQVETDAARVRPDTGRISDWIQNLFRIRPDGMVSEAWKRGHKLGVIASSDHVSTHISYAMVYSQDASRKGLLEAIRKRHTYGATDNIILEVGMGEHFMGDEFSTEVALPVVVKVQGTAPIERVDLLKDGQVIHSVQPGTAAGEWEFPDNRFDLKPHFYYVRLLQEDGMMAWSSPFFVNYPPTRR